MISIAKLSVTLQTSRAALRSPVFSSKAATKVCPCHLPVPVPEHSCKGDQVPDGKLNAFIKREMQTNKATCVIVCSLIGVFMQKFSTNEFVADFLDTLFPGVQTNASECLKQLRDDPSAAAKLSAPEQSKEALRASADICDSTCGAYDGQTSAANLIASYLNQITSSRSQESAKFAAATGGIPLDAWCVAVLGVQLDQAGLPVACKHVCDWWLFQHTLYTIQQRFQHARSGDTNFHLALAFFAGWVRPMLQALHAAADYCPYSSTLNETTSSEAQDTRFNPDRGICSSFGAIQAMAHSDMLLAISRLRTSKVCVLCTDCAGFAHSPLSLDCSNG